MIKKVLIIVLPVLLASLLPVHAGAQGADLFGYVGYTSFNADVSAKLDTDGDGTPDETSTGKASGDGIGALGGIGYRFGEQKRFGIAAIIDWARSRDDSSQEGGPKSKSTDSLTGYGGVAYFVVPANQGEFTVFGGGASYGVSSEVEMSPGLACPAGDRVKMETDRSIGWLVGARFQAPVGENFRVGGLAMYRGVSFDRADVTLLDDSCNTMTLSNQDVDLDLSGFSVGVSASLAF